MMSRAELYLLMRREGATDAEAVAWGAVIYEISDEQCFEDDVLATIAALPEAHLVS